MMMTIIYQYRFICSVENGKEVQEELFKMTGQKTVPNIFINGKHVGGSTDLEALEKSGELDKLVAK